MLLDSVTGSVGVRYTTRDEDLARIKIIVCETEVLMFPLPKSCERKCLSFTSLRL